MIDKFSWSKTTTKIFFSNIVYSPLCCFYGYFFPQLHIYMYEYCWCFSFSDCCISYAVLLYIFANIHETCHKLVFASNIFRSEFSFSLFSRIAIRLVPFFRHSRSHYSLHISCIHFRFAVSAIRVFVGVRCVCFTCCLVSPYTFM